MQNSVGGLTKCPNCGSEFIFSIHRDKVKEIFSPNKEFLCPNCEKPFFVCNRFPNNTESKISKDYTLRYFDFYRS